MEDLIRDLKFALRKLFARRGASALAILCLALGIGGTTTVFSLLSGILLQPLPFIEEPRELVAIQGRLARQGVEQLPLSDPEFLEARERLGGVEIAGLVPWYYNLTGVDEPARLVGGRVSAELFPLLGVEPVVGSTFSSEEEAAGERAALLSHGLWQRRFGGDTGILGQTISLNDQPHTVYGVMPEGFEFLIPTIDVWTPWAPRREAIRRVRRAFVLGRLGEGISLERGISELEGVARSFVSENPDVYPEVLGYELWAKPYTEFLVGDVRAELWMLFAAVVMVLAIACFNVANLLLAQAATREKEVALRTALGAGRGRIVRQLLTESVLLAAVGGVLGLLLAFWGTQAVRGLDLRGVPRLAEVAIDPWVLAFTAFTVLITGLLFGLVPAWKATRVELYESLREGGKTAASARHPVLRGLVVAQLALACVVLIGAGLMVRTYHHLSQIDLGFEKANRLSMELYLPFAKYRQNDQRVAFYDRLVGELETLPGVGAHGVVSHLPLGPLDFRTPIELEGAEEGPAAGGIEAGWRMISPGYFQALGIPLVKGRVFNELDRAGTRPVAVVGEGLAGELWPGEDPLEKRITLRGETEPRTVVGVVGAIKDRELADRGNEVVYVPFAQYPFQILGVVLETPVDPESVAGAVREALRRVDPAQPLSNFQRFEEVVGAQTSRPRFHRLLFGLFALAAVVLVAVGVYGILAYTVAQRRRDIGLKMAMGALRSHVVNWVLAGGLRLVAVGVVLGLVLSWALTRWLESTLLGLVSGVGLFDPLTFATVALGLVVLGFLAALVPAWRASRVDPAEVLREE